ncbi:MAG: T9SS type A sorting domain-containing protein [Ignavibacteriaceae bacterium]
MTYMYYYSVAKDTAGNFVVVWIADKGNKSQMEWRWYNNNCTPSTNVEQLTSLDTIFSSSNSVDVSIDEKGRTVIVWEQNTLKSYKTFGQRFYPDRSKLGTAFEVSKDSSTDLQIYPNVIVRNNKIYTVWQENGIKGNILDFNNVTSIEKTDANIGQIGSYFLYQNYPNPFNPLTVINYQLSADSYVTLKIYDILGNEVKTLVNEYKPQGKYSVSFSASSSGLASGIYFYRLIVNPRDKRYSVYSITKKMVYLK